MVRTKARCTRNQRGAGAGGGWGFDSSAAGGSALTSINNPLAVSSTGNCTAATRPGFLEGGVKGAGLPGIHSGGSRRRRSSRSQRGGRYGFVTPDTSFGPGLAPTSSIACEARRTPVPLGGATGNLNVRGSELWSGAGGSREDGAYGMMIPTARYTQLAGANDYIQSAAGTHEMINAPLGSAQMNPACLKTGGGKSKKTKKAKKSKSKKAKKSKSKRKTKRSNKSRR